MTIKYTPVSKSVPTPFGPLPTSSPLDLNLAKEAKRADNLEKGKAADERYLGEQQRLEVEIEISSKLPWED
jgi:hypothetical protein